MTKLQVANIDTGLTKATQASFDEAFWLIVYATEREFTDAIRISRNAAKSGL